MKYVDRRGIEPLSLHQPILNDPPYLHRPQENLFIHVKYYNPLYLYRVDSVGLEPTTARPQPSGTLTI